MLFKKTICFAPDVEGNYDSMYTIVPVDLLATQYDVFYKGEHIAKIMQHVVSIKDKVDVIIKNQHYRLSRQGIVSGDWKFESDNTIIATASRPNFLKDKFIISFDSYTLVIKSKFMSLKNQFLIYKDSSIIGTIAQTGFFPVKWNVLCVMMSPMI